MTNKLAIIPARRDSKGIPGKNWKELNGKPLIQYTIDTFFAAETDFDLIISTNDPKIKDIAELYNLKIHERGDKTASDNAAMFNVIIEVFDLFKTIPDQFLLLQPTSPFRSSKNIQDAIKMMDTKTDGIIGMKTVSQYPELMFTRSNEGLITPFLDPKKYVRRQDLTKYYYPTGSIYLLKSAAFLGEKTFYPKQTKILEIEERNAFDIDTTWDWYIAELLMKTKSGSKMKKGF